MPRKRAGKKSNERNSITESITTMDDSKFLSNGSIMPDDAQRFTKEGLKRSMEEMLAAVEAKGRETIEEIEAIHGALRASLSAKELSTPISLDKLSDLASILDGSILDILENEETTKLMTPGTLKRPRRSQSTDRGRLPTIAEDKLIRHGRSSSAGTNRESFETPVQRTMVQRLMSANKYTVKKPYLCEKMTPAVSMKRAMRVGEEAISTSGSPLFVQSRVPSVPEINIPLKNGMILNIDPEIASKKLMIPQLDESTKEKIKLMCEKLQKCIN